MASIGTASIRIDPDMTALTGSSFHSRMARVGKLAGAALAGRKDPGRKAEMAAIKDAEDTHREALGLTLAANTALAEVTATIRGDLGAALEKKVTEQGDTAREQRIKDLEVIGADIAVEAGLAASAEWIKKARSGNGRLPPTRGDTPKPVAAYGTTIGPTRLVELLREWRAEW